MAICAVLLSPALASADVPSGKPLYHDGPDGRILMGGQWLFRFDPNPGDGVKQGFQKSTSTSGWTPVSVPNTWNASDDPAKFTGEVGWYRKDFTLPSKSDAYNWIVRFESVNYRSKVWLNGKPLGKNTGAYLPFEFSLAGVKRTGVNHLVIRIDNTRRPTDFPPSGLNVQGQPTGGWWNYGGILREVYLRRVNTVDWDNVLVRPNLPCATCPATISFRTLMRNVTGASKKITVTGKFGDKKLKLGTGVIGAHGLREFTASLKVNNPKLWFPQTPNLYPVSFTATAAGADSKGKGKKVAGYQLNTGIRSIKVSGDGRLQLNGKPMNFRGVGMHEDTKQNGFAISNADRDLLMADVKDLGATVIRVHYPLSPYVHELADKMGIMIWSEIPVYSLKTKYLGQGVVRQLAVKELKKNIETNGNHPSVLLWSIANELSPKPGPTQGSYIRMAANEAHKLDPTRPVGMAVSAYPSAGCQTEYAPLDVLGVNEYFGWYPGPGGQTFDRNRLSGYLDTFRGCYPEKAVVVSEFGAEANRDGPIEEKGTWAFQQDFVNFHLGVFATKPWLSGAIYWAIREFRVRPNWDGGNPRPDSPIHEKGLITYDNVKKPAWYDVQRIYKGTQQLGP